MNPVARARHVLARRPWLYWSAVLVLAAGAGWAVAAAAAGVDDARRAWGTTPRRARRHRRHRARRRPGDPHRGAGPTRPGGPPRPPSTRCPPGAIARQHVAAGEALVAVDVAPTSGPQALIPAGSVAVAVAEAVPSGAAVGDRVVAASGGVVLAADAVVVGLTADAVLVAVPVDEAPRRGARRDHRRPGAPAGPVSPTAARSFGPAAGGAG